MNLLFENDQVEHCISVRPFFVVIKDVTIWKCWFNINIIDFIKNAIFNIVKLWPNSKVNTLSIELWNNSKPSLENILTIAFT